MMYTVKLDPDAADLLVANILRDCIESDFFDDDKPLLDALVQVHNYFSTPDKHIQPAGDAPEETRKGSFTKEEDDYLRWAHEQRLGIEEMAATLNRPYGTVGKRRFDLGLKYHRWYVRAGEGDA